VRYLFKLIKVIFDCVELVLDSSLKLGLLALECLHTGKCLLCCDLVPVLLGVLGSIGIQLAGRVIFRQDVANGCKHVLLPSGLALML
jgi:hypothetical protein